jgi:hypothetical protein
MATHSSPVLKLAGLTTVRRQLAARAHRQAFSLDAAVCTFFDVKRFDFLLILEFFICFLWGTFNQRVLRGLGLATGFFVAFFPVLFLAKLAAVADKLASRANLKRDIGGAAVGALQRRTAL